MKSLLCGILFLLLLTANLSLACSLPTRSKPYGKFQQETYYDVLEVPKASLTDSSSSKDFQHLAKFQKHVLAKTNVDPYYLMKKQKVFYDSEPVERRRYEKLIGKKVGQIRGISCLESFLLDNHLRKFSVETEFSAYVLTKRDSDKAIVIIYSQKSNGTVTHNFISALIEKYRRQEWKVASHIHNHPFGFNNRYGDIAGTVIPSNPDIETYQYLKQTIRMESAIVTNGFHSLVLRANEFNLL